MNLGWHDAAANAPLGPHLASSFEDYQESVYQRLCAARNSRSSEEKHMAKLCSPFEWQPQQASRQGVLLIHGLLDTPFATRDVAAFFVRQGFCARAISLRGHGSVPQDLKHVHYIDWMADVHAAIAHFKKRVDEIYLCGFSLGGLLAIEAGLQGDPAIKGLCLMTPANRIKSRLAPLAPYVKYASWIPRAQWLTHYEENDPLRYQSVAINAGAQVYLLSQHVERALHQKKLNIPMFMALTLDDETVDAKASLDFFQQHWHPRNRAILFARDKPHDHRHNIEYVQAAVHDENILSLSHAAVGIAPDNLYYGKHGDYTRAYQHKIKTPYATFGAIHNKQALLRNRHGFIKEHDGAMYRLYYNPHFERLEKSLGWFLGVKITCN